MGSVGKQKASDAEKKAMRCLDGQGAFGDSSSNLVRAYATPYALSYHATSYQIGLLTIAQSLATLLSQLPGAKLVEYLGSRKKTWLLGAVLTRLMWIPLILLPFLLIPNQIAVGAVILSIAVAQFFNALKLPAWSSLVGDLVRPESRARYFGRRNMISGIATALVLAVAGWILLEGGFSTLFLAALILGMVGISFTARIPEPPFKSKFFYKRSLELSSDDFRRSLRVNRKFYTFTAFTVAFTFANLIASPFYAVYMLQSLHVGYAWFGAILFAGSIAGIISQPYWGGMADRFGDRTILATTATLAVLIPLFWIVASDPIHALLITAVDGFAFAGFGLTAFTFLLGTMPAERRAAFAARHTMAREAAVICGAFVGGTIAVLSSPAWFLHGLRLVFLSSAVMLILSLSLLAFVKHAPKSPDPRTRDVFFELVAVAPMRGSAEKIEQGMKFAYKARYFHQEVRDGVKRAKDKTRLWKADKTFRVL